MMLAYANVWRLATRTGDFAAVAVGPHDGWLLPAEGRPAIGPNVHAALALGERDRMDNGPSAALGAVAERASLHHRAVLHRLSPF